VLVLWRLLVGLGVAATLLTACASGDVDAVDVVFTAEAGPDAPFTVEAGQPGRITAGGTGEAVLRISASEAVVLSDTRWTAGEVRDGAVFAAAGHGCGAEVESGELLHVCTEEFRLLEVRPGQPLEETITLYAGLGGLAPATGTFAAGYEVPFWRLDGAGSDEVLSREPDGTAHIDLTYEVTPAG
jgi:hypothetical protein